MTHHYTVTLPDDPLVLCDFFALMALVTNMQVIMQCNGLFGTILHMVNTACRNRVRHK